MNRVFIVKLCIASVSAGLLAIPSQSTATVVDLGSMYAISTDLLYYNIGMADGNIQHSVSGENPYTPITSFSGTDGVVGVAHLIPGPRPTVASGDTGPAPSDLVSDGYQSDALVSLAYAFEVVGPQGTKTPMTIYSVGAGLASATGVNNDNSSLAGIEYSVSEYVPTTTPGRCNRWV